MKEIDKDEETESSCYCNRKKVIKLSGCCRYRKKKRNKGGETESVCDNESGWLLLSQYY